MTCAVDKLRSACVLLQPGRANTAHTPPSADLVDWLAAACQALEKVEGQPAWRVRHLLSLALCQLSDEGKPEEVPKILAKALDLATAANLQPLRVGMHTQQLH